MDMSEKYIISNFQENMNSRMMLFRVMRKKKAGCKSRRSIYTLWGLAGNLAQVPQRIFWWLLTNALILRTLVYMLCKVRCTYHTGICRIR
jgi:hypothetical protein